MNDTRRATRTLGLLAALAAVTSLTAPAAFAAPAEKPAGKPVGKPAAAKPGAQKPATASPAKKAPKGMKDDFNGDGYQDLAVGTPEARVELRDNAGHVAVVYGSKSGLKTSGRQVVHQGKDGVPGTPEADDFFGHSLTSADLNRDGYADLVVSVAGEDWPPGQDHVGNLTVVWGSPKGLARGATPASDIKAKSYTRAMVSGDFDGDGNPDLASGSYKGSLHVLHGPFDAAGAPARTSVTQPVGETEYRSLHSLRAGDVNRDGKTDVIGLHGWTEHDLGRPELVFWEGTATGPAPFRHITDHRRHYIEGDSVDVGDVNGDGYADIAVGLLWNNYTSESTVPAGGSVTHVRGSAQGPLGAKNRVFHLDSPKVPGSPRTSTGFGASVSIGDLDGDRYGDIAVGVTGMAVGGRGGAGAVVTLPGTANGPTSAGSREIHQDTKGVPGAAEKDDLFGSRVKVLDGDGDGRGELAVSAFGENKNAGAVWVLPTDKNGVKPNGSFVFGPEALGLPADPVRFGSVHTS
ncbi:FG-GAP repeat domain-containing protein [Streptomyces sp. NPDC020141]|uniref:FG-GAP repeat domain-containing protein n=1 Tax=Streptomyces sp. NPDC020141 TaxID=3365065 RepID=UPI0037973955